MGGSWEGLQLRSEMAKGPADEQGMQTHRRARLARGDRRAARDWVVRALRNGAEGGGEWLRGKGAGQAAARRAKGRPRAGHANAPPRKQGTRTGPRLGCTCPAQWRGGAGENGLGGRGRGRLLRGERKGDHAQGMLTHRRTACAGWRTTRAVRALRNGAEVREKWFSGKGAGQAAARGAKGRPQAGHANAPPRKTGTWRRSCCPF